MCHMGTASPQVLTALCNLFRLSPHKTGNPPFHLKKAFLLAVRAGDYAQFVGRNLDVALPVLADARVENVAGTTLASLPVGTST